MYDNDVEVEASSSVTNVHVWWGMLTVEEARQVLGEEISVPSPQFFYEPKIALKNVLIKIINLGNRLHMIVIVSISLENIGFIIIKNKQVNIFIKDLEES